jgi:hypothetical protein
MVCWRLVSKAECKKKIDYQQDFVEVFNNCDPKTSRGAVSDDGCWKFVEVCLFESSARAAGVLEVYSNI